MKAFVTGATGFVGGALVRRLLGASHQVRALVRPGADTRQLDGLPVERIPGDLSDDESLRLGMQGCKWVFHTAALYSFWGHTWEDFYQANVEGTRRMCLAAQAAGVQRMVYTSSIAALGIPTGEAPADENTPVGLEDKIGHYKRSKFLAEQVAGEFARGGLPLVIVNPAAPVGVGDLKPTPTGQLIVDFLKGKIFGYVPTGMNIVDVEAVAQGHLLAAERGQVGERYILGGENLPLKTVLDLLCEVTGRKPKHRRIPYGVALGWAYVDVSLARLLPGRIPLATPEKVRISRQFEYYDSGKAVRELGYPLMPAKEALEKAVRWYRENGYVTD